MKLTYKIDGVDLTLSYGDNEVYRFGPWEDLAEAEKCAKAIVERYNSPEINPNGNLFPNLHGTQETEPETPVVE